MSAEVRSGVLDCWEGLVLVHDEDNAKLFDDTKVRLLWGCCRLCLQAFLLSSVSLPLPA